LNFPTCEKETFGPPFRHFFFIIIAII